MKTKKTLFTQVHLFYKNLLAELETADRTISMMYYAFDHGEWSEKISGVLAEKAKAGVRVRLMADQLGQVLDERRHALKNQSMMRELVEAGVEVEIFRPAGNRLKVFNRLHCKVFQPGMIPTSAWTAPWGIRSTMSSIMCTNSLKAANPPTPGI
jgi:phosphatidylserine/phosphatidylglycerophosphate/cardiolipin synthase-like enzyme